MNNKEEFKAFVQKHPELVDYVNKKSNTWQDFYEIWDLYGENNSVWDKYQKSTNQVNTTGSVNDVLQYFKNIKPDAIQSSITNIQKFLGYVSGFVGEKKFNKVSNFDRPINKRFED